MYFPIGWPKSANLSLPQLNVFIHHICCDAVKILVAAVSDDMLGIFYANPLIPIVYHHRTVESVLASGKNKLIVWKPDSRQLAILTTHGVLVLYQLDFEVNGNGILTQIDPPVGNMKRDSAELFIKENIPRLSLREMCTVNIKTTTISTVCCISLSDLLIATTQCELIRIKWTDLEQFNVEHANCNDIGNNNVTFINLRKIPFYHNQNCHLKTVPRIGDDAYLSALEYSPFIGGCAIIFNDNSAAFLIAAHLRFEVQNIHGFWLPEVKDATVCSVNHKFRLLAYGRQSSEVAVYSIEDTTGSLELSHHLSLRTTVMSNSLGGVCDIKWSPDGCVLAVAWANGGLSLWSTFGTLLMSSFNWDFGLNVELSHRSPLQLNRLEWCTEGYQLFMTCRSLKIDVNSNDASSSAHKKPSTTSNVMQMNFVKSTLTMNPCMASNPYILLQGEDTLYLNQGDNLEKIYFGGEFMFPNIKCGESIKESSTANVADATTDVTMEVKKSANISSVLSESKYWSVLQLPQTYGSTNWPIRYSAIDVEGLYIAVAGRTGLAHYSMLTKKWKLFGNESQEKDFVVSGGLLWWQDFIVMGSYSLLDRTDEIRCYPQAYKLDNQYSNKIQVRSPVISLNLFENQVIALTADGIVSLFVLTKRNTCTLDVQCAYEVDVKSICIHPACIVSLTVTNLKIDITAKTTTTVSTTNTGHQENCSDVADAIIVNVCGRILMIQRDACNDVCVMNSMMASCLASCVECFWLSNTNERSPMRSCLWLYSGVHGMRVWLPILPPPENEQTQDASRRRLHSFMSKRIMLAFPLKLYPLAILFDNVIVVGVENETTLYTSEAESHFALPFSMLERKSQVYLHKILRQLIKRNLGYSAWEIAMSCRSLPYFPHSLELLLHEVLEEEATSKEPIPDALLPSVLDFIREFPLYLQTIVQCARKTEIALWPYLFSMAGKPKELFQQCLRCEQLETAASYLIILQNLEPSLVSKEYATLLLDIALRNRKWELAKDLIRFLKAIDPNEIDSPRSSMVINVKIAPTPTQPQVNQNDEVFNLMLGSIARERNFSTAGNAVTTTTTTTTASIVKEKKDKVTSHPSSALPAQSSLLATTLPKSTSLSATTASSDHCSHHPVSVVKRRADRKNSLKEKKETFCIDSILQRHARSLLMKFKLIDLGYMSAYLDFHMVAWLTQEAERSARVDDFVAALICLHEELKLTPPSVVTPITAYDQLQRRHQLENQICSINNNSKPLSSSRTSESGYFSLAQNDSGNGVCGSVAAMQQIAAIRENETMSYGTLATAANPATTTTHTVGDAKSRSNSQMSFDNSNARYCRPYSIPHEHDDDMSSLCTMPLGLNSITTTASTPTSSGHEFAMKFLPDKLSIKLRYLLQLFTEASCTDYALLLSIVLQDAASIGRLINAIIRSESVVASKRIETVLKRLTQWSFDCDCIYRTFLMTLQPHIYLLDEYITSAATLSLKPNGNANVNTDAIYNSGDGELEHLATDESLSNLSNFLQSNYIGNSNSHRLSLSASLFDQQHHYQHQHKQHHDIQRLARSISKQSFDGITAHTAGSGIETQTQQRHHRNSTDKMVSKANDNNGNCKVM